MITGSASTTIDRPPNEVFAVIADITRTGEWSPEFVAGRWAAGATGPAVGARFEGDNKIAIAGLTMKKWTTTKVMVEGHADNRGTNEYNLALGERRADAVRDYLVSLGVATDRITIVSKGEEQPFCSEETEACWQQNRRGHFILTAK